jgi:hypothetical protein
MADFPRFKPLPGEWYYGSLCPTCGIAVPIVMDPEDGDGPFELLPGWVLIACDNGHEHRYQRSKLQRVCHRGTGK